MTTEPVPIGCRENIFLVAAAAHDLRNPLTVITGITEMLQWRLEREGEVDRTRVMEGLKEIDAMAARMNTLIGQLLDATRPEQQHPVTLHREPVDLAALVLEVVCEQRLLGTSHRVCVDVPYPVTGRWDRALVWRVLTNLLSNALKYSSEDSTVVVAVCREEAAAGSWAVLTVTDHGDGIPPHDLSSVFDPYYRTRRAHGTVLGVGLGLAIVRKIVDQHGGQVTITSEEGKGTTVMVRLPAGVSRE